MKIIILGAGFLGTKIYTYFSRYYEVLAVDKNPIDSHIINIDALNTHQLKNFLYKHKPDIIINTIALSSYYYCELNKQLCMEVNYELANNIADLSNEIKAKLIFISSSYIFNGNKGNYLETDLPDSNTSYAQAKILAEKSALKYPSSLVLRIDSMFGYDQLSNKIRVGTNIFASKIKIAYPNLIRSPVLVDDVPVIIYKLINLNQVGIFNIASDLQLNWLECIRQLAAIEQSENQIQIVSSKDWILEPPFNTSLNTKKLKSYNCIVNSFSDSLTLLKSKSMYNN